MPIVVVQDMSFDLGDCTKWEFMFPQTEQPQLLVPEQEGVDDNQDEDVSEHIPTVTFNTLVEIQGWQK